MGVRTGTGRMHGPSRRTGLPAPPSPIGGGIRARAFATPHRSRPWPSLSPGLPPWLSPRGVVLAGWLLFALPVVAAASAEIRPFTAAADPISEHRTEGAWTLVMFWSVTCSICATESPGLSAFHEEEARSGVNVLGVSIDGAGMREEVAAWMARHQMRFPTLLGDLAQVAGYFSAATGEPFRGTPSFLMFDPRGRLVGVNVGPVRVQAVREFIARKQEGR